MPSQEELKMFKSDFIPMLKLCRTLISGFRDEFLDERNLKMAKEYAERFSEKYRTLRVVMEKGRYDLPRPVLLLRDEKNFYDIFSVAESLIPNIDSARFVVNGKYQTYPIIEFKLRFDEFKSCLLKENVYFNYVFESVNRKLQLSCREEYGMIQIVDDDFMFDENDPEYKLCMHYAFDKGYDEKINLSKYPLLFIGRTEAEPESYKGAVGGRSVF